MRLLRQYLKRYYRPGMGKIILQGTLLLVLLIFLTGRGLSPGNYFKNLDQVDSADSIIMYHFGTFSEDPELSELIKEKSFKNALLDQSEKDSIQLVIDLNDSIIGLTYRGLFIHNDSLNLVKTDPLLIKLTNSQYVKLFSRSSRVSSIYSTIVKEPIVVRDAPKDTAEARLNAWQPDTMIQHPAFLRIELENGIVVVIEQDVNPDIRDKWVRLLFLIRNWGKDIGLNIADFFTFHPQQYRPEITLRIPVDELRAIYRALPENGYVVISMDYD